MHIGLCKESHVFSPQWRWWLLFTGSIIIKSMYLACDTLWPNDDIWRHRFGSTMAQVIACCLMAPSHYLNQCLILFDNLLWYSPQVNFWENAQGIYHWYELESYLLNIKTTWPCGHWFNKKRYVTHRVQWRNSYCCVALYVRWKM